MYTLPLDETLPAPSRAQERFGKRLYPPQAILRAYGMDQAHRDGLDGRGATVALLNPGAHPHPLHDVAALSKHLGGPPPQVEVLSPQRLHPAGGPEPAPGQIDDEAAHVSAAAQAVHLMAPRARLLLVDLPYLQAAPAMLAAMAKALTFLTHHRKAQVVALPYGYAEPRHAAHPHRAAMDHALHTAAEHGISVPAATGNEGPAEFDAQENLYPRRTVSWPNSHPAVTAVGGCRLHLDEEGHRIRPDQVWSAEPAGKREKASGGGRSDLYARPAYQDGAAELLGPARGTPDLVLNASGQSRMWLRDGAGGHWRGWAGTSIAACLLAGILACAAGARGEGLGCINPTLYKHANDITTLGLADLTQGRTSANGVEGFPALPGYDLAGGLGALHNGPTLIKALLNSDPRLGASGGAA